MEIAIRHIAAPDRENWENLWNGYLAFYEVVLPPGVTDTTWQRLLEPGEDMHGLCATGTAGRPVGFVHFLFHRVTWSVADRCYLEDLFVAPDARGSGIGRKLIEAVYAAADARGADQVYWLTQDFNTTARKLYDRVGRQTPFIKYQR